MNSTFIKPGTGFVPVDGHVLWLIAAIRFTGITNLRQQFSRSQFRTFVRHLSVGCVRTSACIAASSVVGTETRPSSAFVLSATRLRLCPNTRRSWVPVVTQENCTCRTATGRAAICGSSTPTYPNNLNNQTYPSTTARLSRLSRLTLVLGIAGTPAQQDHSPNHPNHPSRAGSTGRRSGGPATTARTVAAALTRSLVRTGGF